jgi:hypothetical protein
MVFPSSVPAAEATANPQEAVLVNLRDAQGRTAGQQFLVHPQGIPVDVVPFLKKLTGDLNEPDSVADP